MMYFNPSYAGSEGGSRVRNSYRSQGHRHNGGYQTAYLSYDQYVRAIRGAVGFQYYRDDVMGKIVTNRFEAIYAPLFTVKKILQIRPSLAVAHFRKKIYWPKFTFGDQIHPQYGFIYRGNEYPGNKEARNLDFSSGLLLTIHRIELAAAVFHLNKPDHGVGNSSVSLERKYTLYGRGKIFRTRNQVASCTMDVHYMKQESFEVYSAGLTGQYKKWLATLQYRWNQAVVLSAGYAGKRFRISYSFDRDFLMRPSYTGGTHEGAIIVLFNTRNKEGYASLFNGAKKERP